MFVVKRNQVIITALVVMVAVAGYLNYIDKNPAEPSEIVLNDEGDIITPVPDNGVADADEDKTNTVNNDTVTGETKGDIGVAVNSDDSKNADATKPAMANDTQQNLDNSNNTAALNGENDKNTEVANNVEVSNSSTEPGAAVFVNTSSDSSYFVQAKLDREQARSKQKDILTEMINNSNVEQAQKAECANVMLEIQQRIEKETAAESMIEAKGFSEVYVRIDDDTVDVVVNKEALSEAEIAQIEDIVKRKTGVSADKIRISPIKK